MSFFTWIYNEGKHGPIVHYDTEQLFAALHVFVRVSDNQSNFYVSFVTRDNLNDNNVKTLETLMATNSWQYVGFTYDHTAGLARMYIDGVMAKSLVVPKYELNTKFKIKIGGVRFGSPSTKAFKGRLSCLQIYDKALTKAEVLTSQRYCARNADGLDPNAFDAFMFLITSERCLTGHVFHNETDVTDVPTCIGHCLSAGVICRSLNFINEVNGKCQLNNATKAVGLLRVDSKCVYYERV